MVSKKELITEIATATEQPAKTVKAIIDEFWAKITDHVKAGSEVQFIGIGKFYKQHRNERNGRNPQTGETIKIAASDKLEFKSSLKF